MIAEKIEDPNVPTDVVLNYGYKDFSGRFDYGLPHEEDAEMLPEERGKIGAETPSRREVKEFLEDAYKDTGTDLREREPKEEELDIPSVEIGELATEPKRMPIQEVMLRGYE